MSVLEISSARPSTEARTRVCAADHHLRRVTPVAPASVVWVGTRPAAAPVVLRRSAAVRACRPGSTPVVVDDVPTWVLLVAGVVVALVLMVVLVLAGGPASA